MNPWTNFFVVAAGASATLAGLVFVALSVNISRILQFSHLPARAAGTMGALILILVCSLATLVPQPRLALGIEILVFGLGGWWLKIFSARHQLAAEAEYQRPKVETLLEIGGGQLQVLPFIAGGVILMSRHPLGLYLVAGGCIAIFICSVASAWILLVEILR